MMNQALPTRWCNRGCHDVCQEAYDESKTAKADIVPGGMIVIPPCPARRSGLPWCKDQYSSM